MGRARADPRPTQVRKPGKLGQPALFVGAAGVVWAQGGRLLRALRFAIKGGTIVEVEVITGPARLCQLDLAILHVETRERGGEKADR